MARILITSGPTRQYLDPVRYLSNASSGKMGSALAKAAIAAGYDVVVVSGPVDIQYPAVAEVVAVVTTAEMLAAAVEQFPGCEGVIGVAAPCDFAPVNVAHEKIKKSADRFTLEMTATPDIMQTLGERKRPEQWSVGFALETENARANAVEKLKRKHCDLIVLNDASAIGAEESSIDVIGTDGTSVGQFQGTKSGAAAVIVRAIEEIIGHRP